MPRLDDQGSLALDGRSIGNGSERYLAWARFILRSTEKQFYFATAHLEPGMSRGKIATRRGQADAAIVELNRIYPDQVPVIWASDLASSKLPHSGNTAYERFIADGFTDPLGNYYRARAANSKTYAQRMINEQYFTLIDFAKAPKRYARYSLGAHLDDLLLKPQMTVLEWKQVLELTSSGQFVAPIPSGDNMVKVTLQLP